MRIPWLQFGNESARVAGVPFSFVDAATADGSSWDEDDYPPTDEDLRAEGAVHLPL